LDEIARGGERALGRITAAVNAARRRAWAAAAARHGALPGVRVADKMLEGVTCLRLDATGITCHSQGGGGGDGAEGVAPACRVRRPRCWCGRGSAEYLAAARERWVEHGC